MVCLVCGLSYAEISPVLSNYNLGIPVLQSYPKIEYLYFDESKNQQVLIDIYSIDDFTVDRHIQFSIPESNSSIICQLILDQFVVVECYDTIASYEDNNRYSLKLYDTEGTLMFNFGKANYFWVPMSQSSASEISCVWQIASNRVLFVIARQTIINGEYQNIKEYYTLTFDPTDDGTKNVQVEKKAAFPCPARGEVNIPTRGQQGDLRVLNLNGQMMDSQHIQQSDYQQVNTSSYPTGTYIYQAGNETGKFIVE